MMNQSDPKLTMMHHVYFLSVLGLVMLVISPGNCSESYETRTQSPTANDSTPSSNISSSSSPEVLEPELSSFSLVAWEPQAWDEYFYDMSKHNVMWNMFK